MRKRIISLIVLCLCFSLIACSGKKKTEEKKSEEAKEETSKTGFKLLGVSKGLFMEERAWIEYKDENGTDQIALIDTYGRILKQYPKNEWGNFKVGTISNGLTFISTVAIDNVTSVPTADTKKDKIIFLDKNGKELYRYDQPEDTYRRYECICTKNGNYFVLCIVEEEEHFIINICICDSNGIDDTQRYEVTQVRKKTLSNAYLDYTDSNGIDDTQRYEGEQVRKKDLSNAYLDYTVYDQFDDELIIKLKLIINPPFGEYVPLSLWAYDFKSNNVIPMRFNNSNDIDIKQEPNGFLYLKSNPKYRDIGSYMYKQNDNYEFIECIEDSYFRKISYYAYYNNYTPDYNNPDQIFYQEDNKIYAVNIRAIKNYHSELTVSSVNKDHVFITGLTSLNGGAIYLNVLQKNDSLNSYLNMISSDCSQDDLSASEKQLLNDKTLYDFTYTLDDGYSFVQPPYYDGDYALIYIKDSNGTEYFTIIDDQGKEMYEKTKGHVICFYDGYIAYSDGKDYLCEDANRFNDNILNIMDTKGTPHSLSEDLSFLPEYVELFNPERNEYIISKGYKNINYVKYMDSYYNGFMSLDNKKSFTNINVK